jgi:ABC-type glycerol-3-phosphate transport system substrate-binding protein
MLYHPLELDKIYVFQDVSLPRANANLFVRLFEGIKSFTYSFFDPKYNEASEIDDDTIEIWVNKSRLYVEIMQRMIDEDFTQETGIKVQLNIMPDENKIILSNAASTTPDGVIGITFQKPFEFALRDMLVDLRQQEGFYDLASEFNPNSFIPYIFEDGVYAIPETQDVKLLIYRKDVLDELNLDPPDTWQDVIAMVPVLRKYGMNFYAPIGDANAFKGTDKTTPFIYQFGGTLYDQETLTTSLHVEESYQAFEFMTELFTVYNLPVSTANFFQSFRSGTVPVGIGDANTYIQLKYAAPELAGQWGVLPIPGIENEDEIVERWDPTYGSSSIVFKDSAHIEDTWDLISWWSSKEVQARFSYNIQSTLGNRFLYMTANIEGFQLSAWPSDTKSTILEQWNWIETTGRVPGDYMLERELSNAWNRVVFSGVHPRVAIDEATIQINLELARKLREFGYMDESGTILRPFIIPTRQNIEEWLISDE